jgi:hypothetical protein
MYYFDTSFLAPLILEEATSTRVEAFIARLPAGTLYVSDRTRLEFSSLLAREVRMGGLTDRDARAAEERFGQLVEESCRVITPSAADFDLARGYVLTFATGLRSGDALHLAIARNHGMKALYTLDETMVKAGRLLRVPVARGIARISTR